MATVNGEHVYTLITTVWRNQGRLQDKDLAAALVPALSQNDAEELLSTIAKKFLIARSKKQTYDLTSDGMRMMTLMDYEKTRGASASVVWDAWDEIKDYA